MLRTISDLFPYRVPAVAYSQVLFSEARSVPKMVNYQGYLTDTLGSPIDDSLDMTLSFFTARLFDDLEREREFMG